MARRYQKDVDSRQGRKKGFQSVGFLFKNLQKSGIKQQVLAARNVEFAKDIICAHFGDGALQHAMPTSIKNRVLVIRVLHPAVAQGIREQSETIIAELNERIGYAEVTRIQFDSMHR